MSKQISTKTTIRNLTAEIKKTFVKKDAFTPVQTAANAAIKSLGVDGNTVNFYTSTDKSGTAAFSVDFPSELFLDQTKTTFVAKFKFDAATYPGATDPKLDGKPVMVLAVKGQNPDNCTYSFLNMADWMTMLATENTALCTPAGRPMLKMRFRLVPSMRSSLHSTRTHLSVRVSLR